MCILLHNKRVGISGNIILFSYMFCPNTGTKFREHYHLNHVIPRLAYDLTIFLSDSYFAPVEHH